MGMFKKLKDWRKKHFPTRWEKLQAYDKARKAYEQTDEYKRISEAYEKKQAAIAAEEAAKKKAAEERIAKEQAKKKKLMDDAIEATEMIEEQNQSLKGLDLHFYDAWRVPYTVWFKRSTGEPPMKGYLIVQATDDDQYMRFYDPFCNFRELDKRVRKLIFVDPDELALYYTTLQRADEKVSDVDFDFSEMLG